MFIVNKWGKKNKIKLKTLVYILHLYYTLKKLIKFYLLLNNNSLLLLVRFERG